MKSLALLIKVFVHRHPTYLASKIIEYVHVTISGEYCGHSKEVTLSLFTLLQTDTSLSSYWGSVNGKGVLNVTGPANDLMACECEHCK